MAVPGDASGNARRDLESEVRGGGETVLRDRAGARLAQPGILGWYACGANPYHSYRRIPGGL